MDTTSIRETYEAKRRLGREKTWAQVQPVATPYAALCATTATHPDRPALTFQITSGPRDRRSTLSYREMHEQVTKLANALRAHGIGDGDVVALVMPNCTDMAIAMQAAMTAGIAMPVNPLLEAEQISAILRESKAKLVISLRAIPKTDIAQKVAQAIAFAPDVTALFEVDLAQHLGTLKRTIVGALRPKNPNTHHAKLLQMPSVMAAARGDALEFDEGTSDRICAYFHTGGTTGTPKIAQHKRSGVVFQGWVFSDGMMDEKDCMLCPLPLFHVMAGHVALGMCIQAGAHLVLPTPQGYRGDGVFDNYWSLIEAYKATMSIVVPTAAAALMQRPVNADVSSLRYVVSGSAPMPLDLFRQFHDATGMEVLEGYGMTENTCMAAVTPIEGRHKVGSVGLPAPFCSVEVRKVTPEGDSGDLCAPDEIGEICVYSPGVVDGATYIEAPRNEGIYTENGFLRTGDLGRIDADGYVWITGRAKDLIIRGGHNIDPAEIEEALIAHHDVAFVAAVGQPDLHAGELPCAYVELVAGATVTQAELMEFARAHIWERAAVPKHLEICNPIPLTMVGKVFKPELRKRAIARVFDATLNDANLAAKVSRVEEDGLRGLVVHLEKTGPVNASEVQGLLSGFVQPWEWVSES